ncbi:pyridoxamine 5'-phosphate oxidase family protein [Streptacidiphilus monticola]|uniref:Pyridoxamine 5'-phosphate oxidase family protein n=1 Tax=Streptacidiphilus monticola TaxID=2161674 RepID=A0ABW1FUN6_9ACTN
MTSTREPLTERECLQLLAGARVGRLVYTAAALPAVLPMRFSFDRPGGFLLLLPGPEDVAHAVDGTIVAFEAGEIDASDGSGWTVTVLGQAVVEPMSPSAREPAQPGADLRLRAECVTGHRILPSLLASP